MDLFNMSALAESTAATTSTTGTTTTTGDALSMIIMIVVMIAIFYFMLIRPQRKKDKQVKNMLSSLKVGDRICTIGGLYGTIKRIKDEDITLSMGSLDNEIVIARWAVRSVENKKTENDSMPEV